jgi:hypothetical protein
MDEKQCYKNFRKGYPEFNKADNFPEEIEVESIAKQKSKNFFLIKFKKPLPMSIDDFSTKYCKNKRVKVKSLQGVTNLE